MEVNAPLLNSFYIMREKHEGIGMWQVWCLNDFNNKSKLFNKLSKCLLKNQRHTCHVNTPSCSLMVTHDISTTAPTSSTSSFPYHQNLLVLSTIPTRLDQIPLPSDFRLKWSWVPLSFTLCIPTYLYFNKKLPTTYSDFPKWITLLRLAELLFGGIWVVI